MAGERPNILSFHIDNLGMGELGCYGGGIVRGADAAAKLEAGATLVQFYSGMVYRGPALIGECVEAIRRGRGAGT